jgi:hypothetical protein
VRDVPSPGYRADTHAVSPATGRLSLNARDVIARGDSGTVIATFADPADRPTARNVVVALRAPDGWTVTPSGPGRLGDVRPGATATAFWTVHAPTGDQPPAAVFSAVAQYAQAGRAESSDAAATVSTPPPPPTGTVFVSDLAFLSATNGWGPVERDLSNGEIQPGDGHTIT